jgi:hypothetical protein
MIVRVPCGQRVWRNFNAQCRSRVTIEAYPTPLLNRLRLEVGTNQFVGACFFHDGRKGTIHYDPAAPLGVLGPFIVHEFAHATDQELWTVPFLPKDSSLRDAIFVKTELRAFQLQQEFIRELKCIDDNFRLFIDQVQSQARILAENFSPSEILSLYNLKKH